MSSDTMRELNSTSPEATLKIGEKIAAKLQDGDVIELVGDLGSGKTQFVRGLAAGLSSTDTVQSPTFTIQRIYGGGRLKLFHYDFYRLSEPGLMQAELQEILTERGGIVVIEWAQTIATLLPTERLTVHLTSTAETMRLLTLSGPLVKRLVD